MQYEDKSDTLSIFTDSDENKQEENEPAEKPGQNNNGSDSENNDDKNLDDDINQELKELNQLKRDAGEDELSDISEIDDKKYQKQKKQEYYSEDEDDIDLNQEVQFQAQKRHEYDYDDDDYGEQEVNSQKRKRTSENKKGRRRKHDDDDVNNKSEPQESKKDQKQRKMADQGRAIYQDLNIKMEKALKSDMKSKQLNRPALKRVKLIEEVEKKLRNEYVRDAFLEENGMKTIHDWLISANNNINLRKRILNLVKNLKINNFEEIEVQAKHFIEMKSKIQSKDPQVLKLDNETRRLYIDIVDSWGASLAKQPTSSY